MCILAEINFTDTADLWYTWKCTRSDTECANEITVSGAGWAVFSVLIVVNVFDDFVCRLKMVIHSGKKRAHRLSFRAQFFVGGVLLFCISTVGFMRVLHWVFILFKLTSFIVKVCCLRDNNLQ